jgi:hypothetical protein
MSSTSCSCPSPSSSAAEPSSIAARAFGHAADLQLFVAVDDQQRDRAAAAQLDAQPAGLFELVAEQ